MAKLRNIKLDLMAKSIGIHFLGLNTFLDVIEIPKPKKKLFGRMTLEYSADIRYIRETSRIRLNETNLLALLTKRIIACSNKIISVTPTHSRHQKSRSYWSAPRIANSGKV